MRKVKYIIVPNDEIASGSSISITTSFVFEDEDLMESIHSFSNEMGLDEDEIAIFEIAKEKKVLKTLSVIDDDWI